MHKLIGVICTFLAVLQAALAAGSRTQSVSIEDFDKLRQETNNVVIDVRTPKEYDSGHIPGARLIDYNSEDFSKRISELDRSKTYLVHCAAGGRSAKASEKMEALGFTNVINLPAGFKGWEKAGKPVAK